MNRIDVSDGHDCLRFATRDVKEADEKSEEMMYIMLHQPTAGLLLVISVHGFSLVERFSFWRVETSLALFPLLLFTCLLGGLMRRTVPLSPSLLQ
jgi:hypothetical protein